MATSGPSSVPGVGQLPISPNARRRARNAQRKVDKAAKAIADCQIRLSRYKVPEFMLADWDDKRPRAFKPVGSRRPENDTEFWKAGRIFCCPFHESPNGTCFDVKESSHRCLNNVGNWVVSKMRKMIIIHNFPGHVVALPVFTYQGHGVENRPNAHEHVAMRDADKPDERENHCPSHPILLGSVSNTNPSDFHQFHQRAYIRFTTPASLDKRIDVEEVGKLDAASFKELMKLYNKELCSTVSQKASTQESTAEPNRQSTPKKPSSTPSKKSSPKKPPRTPSKQGSPNNSRTVSSQQSSPRNSSTTSSQQRQTGACKQARPSGMQIEHVNQSPVTPTPLPLGSRRRTTRTLDGATPGSQSLLVSPAPEPESLTSLSPPAFNLPTIPNIHFTAWGYNEPAAPENEQSGEGSDKNSDGQPSGDPFVSDDERPDENTDGNSIRRSSPGPVVSDDEQPNEEENRRNSTSTNPPPPNPPPPNPTPQLPIPTVVLSFLRVNRVSLQDFSRNPRPLQPDIRTSSPRRPSCNFFKFAARKHR